MPPAFPATGVQDNANRTQNPALGWTFLLNSFQVNGTAFLGNNASYNIGVFPTDYTGSQEVYCTVSTKGATGHELSMGLMSKDTGSLATIDGYAFHWTVVSGAGNDTWAIERVDNGVSTVLANGTVELVNGDVVGLRLHNGVLTAYRNGASLGTANSTTYTGTGKLTLTIENTTWRIDNFGGGGFYDFAADSGTFSITGTAASLLYARKFAADTGAFSVTGTAASLLYNRKISADTTAFAITGTAASLLYSRRVAADSGAFAITGTAAGLLYHRIFAADGGIFAITGTAAGLYRGYTLAANGGTFSITGTAASLLYARVFTASGGTFAISGTAASLLFHRLLSAAGGSFVITGTDATLTYDSEAQTYTLTADSGTFAVTGTSASLLFHRLLSANGGAFTVTGTAASLLYNRLLSANGGAFAVTGTAASLLYNRRVSADGGAFTITGTAAGLLYSRIMSAGIGSFLITGTDADLTVLVISPPDPISTPVIMLTRPRSVPVPYEMGNVETVELPPPHNLTTRPNLRSSPDALQAKKGIRR